MPVPSKVRSLLKQKSKIRLDVGGGPNPQPGYVVMDRRQVNGKVDIVWECERTPWPLPDNCCSIVLMSHLWEHLDPAKTIDIANEVWRVMEPGGQWQIVTPYGNSYGYLQDPTHRNPAVEATWFYFCPKRPDGKQSPLYHVYEPKPWELVKCEYQIVGNMLAVMNAIKNGGG
jgi:hypothetical protein